MITADGYRCDFCGGMVGEFLTITGNHVACQEADLAHKQIEQMVAELAAKNARIAELTAALEQSRTALNSAQSQASSLLANLPYYQNISEISEIPLRTVLSDVRLAYQQIELAMKGGAK